MTQPNLFSYATSELSQDAFICWLAEWANPKFKYVDAALHQTAQNFIVSMINKAKPDYDSVNIKTVEVKRQLEKLDILIKINSGLADKIAILVEDKTHTSNHSDQLNRYYGKIKEYGYDESQMVPIYFKTGYQSKFDVGNYNTYLREDLLKLLRQGSRNVKNAIYDDFLAHLEHMEAVVNLYVNTRLFNESGKSVWVDNDWRGFFIQIYKNRDQFYTIAENDQANWNYVANPTGGFFGFWWYFKPLQNQLYRPYLQLENNSLCFKIEVLEESKRSIAREEAYGKLVEAANRLGIKSVERPKRMGSGQYMTVSRWNSDYRAHENGLLNFKGTLENLKKAQQILDAAFPL